MYTYILTQRPPSIGTHPIDGLIEISDTNFRNRNAYLLAYPRELTSDEIKRYELTPDYSRNEPTAFNFTFAGEEITEDPKVTGHNEITTFVNGEEYDKYSFLAWHRRITE